MSKESSKRRTRLSSEGMVEGPRDTKSEKELCPETHSMKVKSVVVGSMLMVRGLVAPSRTKSQDGAAG
jgi:hypothetical protein